MTDKSISLAGEPDGKSFQDQLNLRQPILVVDNDGDIRRLNTDVLVGAGCEVDAAADGALASDMLQFKRYDLLVRWEKLKRHPWLQMDATLLKSYAPGELLAEGEKVLFVTAPSLKNACN